MVNSDAPKGKFMLYNGGVTLAKNPVRKKKSKAQSTPLYANNQK
jgi:hypothetical protein